MSVAPLRKGEDLAPPQRGVFLLPSILTTCGLFAGFYSVIASVRGDFWVAAASILVANIFDVLDGRVARMTRTTTRFGFEYDSLSDVIAFGVAPGILVYSWSLQQWGPWGWLAASSYVACGALRLARFNVQTETTEKRNFQGLPIPAAAEVIASTVLLYYYFGGEGELYFRPLSLLLVTFALAGLMVSNFKFFSFKEGDLLQRKPFASLVGIVFVLTLLIAFPQPMLFVGFVGYAASGPWRWLWVRLKQSRRRRRGTPKAA